MKEYKVIVLGLGNLGKRHVEALLRSESDMQIYCVDVVEKTDAEFEGSERKGNKELHFLTDYSLLPGEVDLAIIATVSSVRKAVFKQLISSCNIKYIVFEKVLFTRVEDYQVVLKELNDRGIKAWVNCGRRVTNQYADVRELLKDEQFFEAHASGGRWGLLCNGIHILDIIACLAGEPEGLKIDSVELWSEPFEGKRSGFYEAYGSVKGKVSRCRNFTVSCYDSDMPLEMVIVAPGVRITICEGKRKVFVEKKETGWEKISDDFVMPYVSVGMTSVVDGILAEGKCNLPEYSESTKIHLEYLRHLEKFFIAEGFEKGNIPIT